MLRHFERSRRTRVAGGGDVAEIAEMPGIEREQPSGLGPVIHRPLTLLTNERPYHGGGTMYSSSDGKRWSCSMSPWVKSNRPERESVCRVHRVRSSKKSVDASADEKPLSLG